MTVRTPLNGHLVNQFPGDSFLLALADHGLKVTSVAVSPDGTPLAMASFDQTARVRELLAPVAAGAGVELLTLPLHAGLVLDTAFSPDGKHLATSGSSRTA